MKRGNRTTLRAKEKAIRCLWYNEPASYFRGERVGETRVKAKGEEPAERPTE